MTYGATAPEPADGGTFGIASQDGNGNWLNADEVRAREQYYRQRGIQAVPSVLVAGTHLIQGGQPSEFFEQALRTLAAEGAER